MPADRNLHTEPDDDHLLDPSEATDSDELHNRDGDQPLEPPDSWRGANQYGMTEEEAVQGESLDSKLSAEEPEPSMSESLSDPEVLAPDAAEHLELVDTSVIDEQKDEDASFFTIADEDGLDVNRAPITRRS